MPQTQTPDFVDVLATQIRARGYKVERRSEPEPGGLIVSRPLTESEQSFREEHGLAKATEAYVAFLVDSNEPGFVLEDYLDKATWSLEHYDPARDLEENGV